MDLIVTMDETTNEIYSAFLVEEAGTDLTFRGFIGGVRPSWAAAEPPGGLTRKCQSETPLLRRTNTERAAI
jgi:hypothetical protein